MTKHAKENLETKSDRVNITDEKAQSFVDNAKVTIFQQDRSTIKYISNDGYCIANLYGELVTSVPQK